MSDRAPGKAELRLRELGVRGVLLEMAKGEQILEVICEMPNCYCPKGRKHFDAGASAKRDWKLSFDHYPQLESDGGTRVPGNARLGHVLCNNEDYGRRLKIRTLLNKGESLQAIADKLNTDGNKPPHGEGGWTAARVRKVQVS